MTKETQNEKGGMKYFRVKFKEASSVSQPKNIVLSLNGERVEIRRGVEVVLPEPFLEVARNAVGRVTEYDEETRTQLTREIATASFDLLGEGTEQEYRKMTSKR